MVYSVAPVDEVSGAEGETQYRIVAAAHNVDGEMDRPAPVDDATYPTENDALIAAYALLGDDDSLRRNLARTWKRS